MADLKFDVDYSDLSRSLDVLMEMGKASKNTATAFEQSFRQIKRWQDTFKGQQGKINAQLETTHQKLQLANKSAKDSAQAFIAHEKAIEGNTLALNKFRSSYDATYATEQRTLQLKKLLRQEIANGNMTVRQAGAELLKYRKNLVAFNQVQMAATKSSNRMGVVTQQAGYQVSDFIVQVQSGTNPFVAFSQQASQLVGVLPLVAGSIGLTTTAAIGLSAGLGIVIPLIGALGAAFLRSREEADEGKKGIDEYTQAIENLQNKAKSLKEERLASFSEFNPDLLAASSKRLTLVDQIGKLQAESVGLSGKDLEIKENLIKTLEEELAKESKRVSQLLTQIKREEDAAAKREAQKEWEEGAEEKLLTLNQRRFKVLMDSIAANDKLNTFVSEERKELEYQNTLLQLQLQFGKDSAAVKQLQIDRAVENYEAELLGKGVAEDTVKELTDQYRLSLNLTEQLKDQVAQAREFKKQVQEVSKSYGKMLEKRILADVLDPRGEAGVTATQALRLGINPFADDGEDDKKTGAKKRDPLAELQKQVELEQALIGKTEARQRIIRALGVDLSDYREKDITNIETQINKTIQLEEAERKRQEAIEEAKRQQEELKDTIESSMEDAFMSVLDGTKTVEEAFRMMARDIIAHLMRVYVVQKMVSSFTGDIPFLNANGNAFSNGNVVPYANGGVVGGPTYFPMAGGKTGLMGEAGPEAIMPLKRGKGGKLGVAVEGGQQPVVINQSFNFQANGDETVRRIIAAEAPKIAEATSAAIVDQRRRGGSMRKTFR